MIVYKSEASDYCGLLPDFPGLFIAGKTLEDLKASVQDAVETWMTGEDTEIFPDPTPLAVVKASEQARKRHVKLVKIDTAFMENSLPHSSFMPGP